MNTIHHHVEADDITLAPSWILTTQHAASSYGLPVLVCRDTGEAYGPADIVRLGGDIMPASMLVARLAKTLSLHDQRVIAEQFCR